ncbi:MAG TPA: T9SS type A sorting domain-containing protein [Bacteroidetes bacterium]|nr:T9SS type A sorting domain-containing protein [Bacteroidota bacterium]
MRLSILLFLLGFIFINSTFAQVITADPAFPQANESVTIFFNASQGTAGLENCNCDVYLHTGVITNLSNAPSDWKYVVTSWGVANAAWKMTPVAGQPNMYSYTISPTIRDYYNVPASETIEKMAFVFRNANGSLEGKDDGGADIFYDVSAAGNPFSANLLSPTSNTLIVSAGETIEVSAAASESATLTLTDNGTQLIQTTGTSLEYTINVQGTGTHTVVFSANNGADIITESFIYAVPLPTVTEGLPAGTINGINYINGNTVVLSLYAPDKQHVFLLGDFNDWSVNTDFQLKNTPDGNTWWIEINGLDAGEEYAFQYLVDGEIRIADPYAEKILDPWNDGFISENIYPGLKPYPAGKTVGIVSVLQTAQEEYNWQDDDFVYPEKTKLVIYELLMRDFLESHSYGDLLDTLSYLDRLGVTAIELMPVSEFEGNNSWGYNPSFHGALDKYYGTPEAFKDFINEAHMRGIAVILDVVYNHAFGQSPLAQLYWDAANNRPANNSPWFNPVPKHPFNVGNDFNHESTATKNYVKQTLAVWINKYHIDGFRFDLSKGFTQRQSSDNGQFAAYDAGRIAILKDYADFIWNINPDGYVILEHFANNTEEKELAEYGMMIWGNSNYDYNEASMGYTSNFSWVSHKQRGWNVPHVVGYMESHDEERQMYKNSQWGNSSGNYDVTDLNTGLSRVELTSTFFFPIPGPKMIWEFGELGYDFSINRCTNGTISDNCRLDPKPIRWDYQDNENRKKIFTVMQQLIELKKTEEVFSTDDFNYSLSGTMKKIHLNSDNTDVTIIGNFGVTLGSINPEFQHTGWWYEFFSGDSILVNDVNENIALNAGGYRLYSSQQFATAINDTKDVAEAVNIFPNPTNGNINVNLIIENSQNLKVDLLDISGKYIAQLYDAPFIKGQELIFDAQQKSGIYILRFATQERVFFAKLIVQ